MYVPPFAWNTPAPVVDEPPFIPADFRVPPSFRNISSSFSFSNIRMAFKQLMAPPLISRMPGASVSPADRIATPGPMYVPELIAPPLTTIRFVAVPPM